MARKDSNIPVHISSSVATRTRAVIVTLYLAMVRPCLMSCAQFWAPHNKKNVEALILPNFLDSDILGTQTNV